TRQRMAVTRTGSRGLCRAAVIRACTTSGRVRHGEFVRLNTAANPSSHDVPCSTVRTRSAAYFGNSPAAGAGALASCRGEGAGTGTSARGACEKYGDTDGDAGWYVV